MLCFIFDNFSENSTISSFNLTLLTQLPIGFITYCVGFAEDIETFGSTATDNSNLADSIFDSICGIVSVNI